MFNWLSIKRNPISTTSRSVARYTRDADCPAVVAALIADNELAIQRIFDVMGMEEVQFQCLVGMVIRNYAHYVYTLPASRVEHHPENGGLFRHGLEVAHLAARLCSDRYVGGGETAEKRRMLKRSWRYAAFLAGLLHDVGKVTAFHVTHEQHTWNPYRMSLATWAASMPGPYSVAWKAVDHDPSCRLASLYLLNALLPPEALTYLCRVNDDGMEHVLKVLAGELAPEAHFFAQLVHDANMASVENDREAIRQQKGVSLIHHGHVSIDTYILDAMRQLIREKWSINRPGARVWVVHDAVYIAWQPACDDIKTLLARDHIAIPRAPDTLAEILLEHRRIVRAPDEARGSAPFYWKILPKNNDPSQSTIEAVKLTQPAALIKPGMQFPTITIEIGQAAKTTARQPAEPSEDIETVNDEHPILPPMDSVRAPHQHTATAVTARPANRDHAQSTSLAQRATLSAEQSHDAAATYFAAAGRIGSFLVSVANDLNAGRLQLGQHVFWAPQGLCLEYPYTIERGGMDPMVVLHALRSAGWLIPDPKHDSRYVVTQDREDGTHAMVFILRHAIGKHLEALLRRSSMLDEIA